jgi:hypothetical protein
VLEPARADVFNFRFSADKNFKGKFERLAEILGVENPLKNMAEVFEKAMDISLEKKDPKRKLERRLEKERKRGASSKRARPDEVASEGGAPSGSDNKAASRYIPSEVRERVHARAGYRCQYEAPDGTRCSSRTGLEIDHRRPFAIYRSHDERHLRLLCKRHNRLQAERVYGAGFIQAKIEKKSVRRFPEAVSGSPLRQRCPIDAEGSAPSKADKVIALPHLSQTNNAFDKANS